MSSSGGQVCERPFKYVMEERVLCFHGQLLYEAKCLKRLTIDNQNRYYVHYNGWNKSWDEWIEENSILQFNDKNIELQQTLRSKHNNKETNNSSKRRKSDHPMAAKDANQSAVNDTNRRAKTETKNGNKFVANNSNNNTNVKLKTNSESKDEKQRRQTVLESEEGLNLKNELKIEITSELKPCLVDDWDLITRQKKLFDLPAKTSVETILDDYLTQRMSTEMDTNAKDIVKQVMNFLKDIFNAIIGTQLLYKFERIQYKELLQQNEGQKMSAIYGSFHLLRLFTKLNPFLSSNAIDITSAQLLSKESEELLKYLSQKSSLFSCDNYSNASPEYCRKTL